MTIEFIWQLPTAGDGRYGYAQPTRRGERQSDAPAFNASVSDPRGTRFNYFDYLHQIARAADLTGFDGLRIPNTPDGDEAWIVAGYVARSTRHLKLLTEFDAARGSAVYAAKNAASYQRFSSGRFAWQISAGGDEKQRRQLGDYVDAADLLPRIEEFITVARGVLTTAPFTFKGKFFEVLNGGFTGPLANNSVPRIYLSGHSDAALQLSARQADTHILNAAPLAMLRPVIENLNRLAAAEQRSLAVALRIDVLARETEAEALRDAERVIAQSNRFIENTQRPRRTLIDDLLWADFASDNGGASATLVGSYAQIAARLVAYAEAGISSFLLGAAPHLEEAYRIGEYVLPKVRDGLAAIEAAA
jgi:alkanesulfonate monooxygenase